MTTAVKQTVPDFDPNVRSTPSADQAAVLEALARAALDREAGTLALPEKLERGVAAECRRRLEAAGAVRVGRTNRHRFPEPFALAAFLSPSTPTTEGDDPGGGGEEAGPAREPEDGALEPDAATGEPTLVAEPGGEPEGAKLPGEVAEAALELLPEGALLGRAFALAGAEPLADLLRDAALEVIPALPVLAPEALPAEPAFDLGLALLCGQEDASSALAAAFAALLPEGRLLVAALDAQRLSPEADALLRPRLERRIGVEDEETGRLWNVLSFRTLPAPEVEPELPDAPLEPLEHRGAEYREVPFDAIVELEDHNPRRTITKESIEELASRIRAQGLLQPLRLRPLPDGRFAVVFGYRRRRAIARLRERGEWPLERPVPAFVGEANDGEAMLLALAENEDREDVDPLEQAEGYSKLRARGHTAAEIAVMRGRTERFVAQRLKLGQGVCAEAKRLYREGVLTLEGLEALSAQPIVEQYEYVTTAPRYALTAEQIRAHFREGRLTMRHARFAFSSYVEAGGAAQEDLFQPEATVLVNLEIARRLQQGWLEGERRRLLEEGWAWAVVVPRGYPRYSHRTGGEKGDGLAGVLLEYDAETLRVDVSEGLLPKGRGYGSVGTADDPLCERPAEATEPGEDGPASSANVTRLGLEPAAKLEAPKAEYTKAFVARARTLRSAALQAGLLGSGDGRLGLALVILGLLGVKRMHVKSHDRSPNDRVAPGVLERLREWAGRLRLAGARVDDECEVERHSRWGDSSAVPLLKALLSFTLEELLELNLALVAARVGDWNEHEPDDKLEPHALTADLARRLGVRGHEGWAPDAEYLGMVANRKAKLYPYLAACGVASPEALSDSTRKALVGEVLSRKDRLAVWCPPELDLLRGALPSTGSELGSPAASAEATTPGDEPWEDAEAGDAAGSDDDWDED